MICRYIGVHALFYLVVFFASTNIFFSVEIMKYIYIHTINNPYFLKENYSAMELVDQNGMFSFLSSGVTVFNITQYSSKKAAPASPSMQQNFRVHAHIHSLITACS